MLLCCVSQVLAGRTAADHYTSPMCSVFPCNLPIATEIFKADMIVSSMSQTMVDRCLRGTGLENHLLVATDVLYHGPRLSIRPHSAGSLSWLDSRVGHPIGRRQTRAGDIGATDVGARSIKDQPKNDASPGIQPRACSGLGIGSQLILTQLRTPVSCHRRNDKPDTRGSTKRKSTKAGNG
ncbi:hypothetical protein BX600DRAFT_221203 [Xylariales sp. PMI_506]|nr:hypothetical protein BX600DRAFT_221203 [Xylariales sp. PMI_506]